MDNMRRITRSLPYAGDNGQPTFPEGSYLKEILDRADGEGDLTPQDVMMYFGSEFARPGANRQSSGILSTFTGMAQPFMSGPIKELFCTTTNFIPEFSRRGAIIILDLPIDEWEEIGRTAQLMFKYIWQRAMVRRQGLPQKEVPVFLWADEAHNFVTNTDPKFLNECRSSLCATVFLSQTVNNYFSTFTTNSEANAYALLAGLGTKIFHRNGDFKTNQWASDTISKSIQIYLSGGESDQRSNSEGENSGYNSGGGHSLQGGSSSYGFNRGRSFNFSRSRGTNNNWQQQMDYQVQPEMFTRLKSVGGVEAIVFKSGAEFPPNGLPFAHVAFKQ